MAQIELTKAQESVIYENTFVLNPTNSVLAILQNYIICKS